MINWQEVERHVNYIAMDYDGAWYGFESRPDVDTFYGEWKPQGEELVTCLGHMGLKEGDWRASLHQRPNTFDNILRGFDSVILKNGVTGYLVKNTDNDFWIVIKENGDIYTLFNEELILGVNRITLNEPKAATKRKKVLVPEVHNNEPIDIARASEAIHDLCKGQTL